ncbi:MAG: peptidase S11 [Rhodocyclales bacterium RIFCSPLOWO2_02_FULL_63_24]|nr:MAG: peptidase S11 [Rhodocyclales bacterium GWA2_65_19]OHC70776.1 MAG: peptidase S11 [Rhodocyclales bacterium RIFCSPLOWO2_02_FULL_63_24]
MKRALLMLLAAAIVGTGATPTDAEAATKKKAVAKKAVAANKKVQRSAKQARVKQTFGVKSAHRGLSLDDARHLALQSSGVLVQDQTTGAILFEKNPDVVLPIASITKLMTAMVVLDAKPDLSETLVIGEEDVDILKGTRSRLKVGTHLAREEMLRLALMSSENRAAAALSRHYPGGREAFVAAMNQKAQALGLADTRFQDPTGLTAANVSSPRDLAKMVDAAHQYPLIREYSTTSEGEFSIAGRPQHFRNTNTLVKSPTWEIGLSKTGYISEAGKCLVMQAWLNNKPTIIVLLDSWGKMTRIGDANRIKRWVESASLGRPSAG